VKKRLRDAGKRDAGEELRDGRWWMEEDKTNIEH
jgi:hypothetical protein